MKTIKAFIILFFLAALNVQAQKEIKTISFHVDGLCGMCKERIENALDVRGVKAADWNRETHECTVTYRTDKVTEEELHQLLNEAGHDTEKSKASEEQYSQIHHCCRYRDMEEH